MLLTVRDHAKRFYQWHDRDVHVYRMHMPRAEAAAAAAESDSAADSSGGGSARMGYYKHLLDSVPPERQSVPLVMHALLEQVSLQ